MSTIKVPIEYDVTFAVKEWLLAHNWDVVAFNPPGSQGTFTIPNPAKDPAYRGQTGSESPDIIAIKNGKTILIVESKPIFDAPDVNKLLNLVKNKERMGLLMQLLEKVCIANKVKFNHSAQVMLAKAHGGEVNSDKNLQTFSVSVDGNWDPTRIDPRVSPYKSMKVELVATDQAAAKLIKN